MTDSPSDVPSASFSPSRTSSDARPDLGRLDRLLRPRTLAVFGGAVAQRVALSNLRLGYTGALWAVTPNQEPRRADRIAYFQKIEDLPEPPDACFIGVNRHATVELVGRLAELGAGGAACYASGFGETQDGRALETELVQRAGSMPLLGPNCYGYVDYLEKVVLWPDQHGGRVLDQGIAALFQSSNIAMNFSMQQSGLPLAFVGALGNQAQTSLFDLGSWLLRDPRIRVLGLHLEGIRDLDGLICLAELARERSIPLLIFRVGTGAQAKQALASHTGVLSGQDAAMVALFDRLGLPVVHTLPCFINALQLAYRLSFRPRALQGGRLCSISCSGGEAGLVADRLVGHPHLTLPPFSASTQRALRATQHAIVGVQNPYDYHTFLWGDAEGLYRMFLAMLAEKSFDVFMLVLDFPRASCDNTDWTKACTAFVRAIEETTQTAEKMSDTAPASVEEPLYLVVATMPENMPEAQALALIERHFVPLGDLDASLTALEALIRQRIPLQAPDSGRYIAASQVLWPPSEPDGEGAAGGVRAVAHADGAGSGGDPERVVLHTESAAKQRLEAAGLPVPAGRLVQNFEEALDFAKRGALRSDADFPSVVLKASGLAHKTEHQAVWLDLKTPRALQEAYEALAPLSETLLIEEMVPASLCELLVGALCDPVCGWMLTLGQGGVETEIWSDARCIPFPVSALEIEKTLRQLRIWPRLAGFRGRKGANIPELIECLLRLCDFVAASRATLVEFEVNPLLVPPAGEGKIVCVDAMLRTRP